MFAAESDVRRGSVLTIKDDIEFVVPSSKLVKIKKDERIDVRATVVDMVAAASRWPVIAATTR